MSQSEIIHCVNTMKNEWAEASLFALQIMYNITQGKVTRHGDF